MDGLAMALHIVWHKKTFKECAIWAANMGGDCDTVGAIACQLAGAIYGFNLDVLDLYSQMKDFTSKKYSVFIKAFKLAKGKERKIIFNTT
jgi:ADP-ribosylglycohydrolase